MPKISVIIPVYNVRNYLTVCLDSILKQSFADYELILVDDGSTDGSGDICDKYAEKDSRIIVIHQKNAGQSNARNHALDIAKGEWIAFVDSDDCIEPIMFEILYNQAVNYNADISSCSFKSVDEKNIAQYDYPTTVDAHSYELSLDDVINGLLTHEKYRFEVWNKLWKRELIGEIRFVESQLCEEVYFDRKIFINAKRFVSTDLPLYHYLTNRNGNTNSQFREKKIGSLSEYIRFNEDLCSIGKERLGQIMLFCEVKAAIQLYYHAFVTKQDDRLLTEIYQHFEKGYKKITNKKIRNKKDEFGMRIFSISPKLYCLIRRFKG